MGSRRQAHRTHETCFATLAGQSSASADFGNAHIACNDAPRQLHGSLVSDGLMGRGFGAVMLNFPCCDVTFPVNLRDMSVISPATAIRNAPARSFVHVNRLPGTATAARQAASRAARSGELMPVRRGLYYRGAKTRYGMTRPRIEEIVREVLGAAGNGPAGYSAAREWGVTTQVPSSFHVAALWTADPIEGVTQHSRGNRERISLNSKEIALLELLRAPEVYVETGWNTLARKVRDAFAGGEVVADRLRVAVASERNVTVRENFDRLLTDAAAV